MRPQLLEIVVVGRRGSGDHRSAGNARHLHRHTAHPTRGAVDQYPLAGVELGVLVQRLPCGQGRCRHPTGLECRQPRWTMSQPVSPGHHLGGKATHDSDESEYLVTDRESLHALAKRRHLPGHFDAGRVRQLQRDERFHGTRQDLPVDRVDPAARHVDEHFTLTRNQVRSYLQRKALRLAVLSNANRFHGASPQSVRRQPRRASRLKRPAPNAATCKSPPAMARFLKKWMNWFWSPNWLWKASAVAMLKTARPTATKRVR